ncbi:MAG: ABC transporter permease [Dehalococcoidia bacterium]
MVGLLLKKLLRDMRRQRAQFIAVSVTIFLGVLLFTASYGAYQNLKESYAATFDRLRFPDLWVTGGDLEGFSQDAAGVRGVETVLTRQAGDVGIRTPDGTVLRGRALSIPDGDPTAARILLDGGESLASGSSAVLAEKHFADHFELVPGSNLELLTGSGWLHATVSGIVISGEYLWPARSRQDILTPPDDFGVVFVTESLATDLPLERQVLVRLSPDTPSGTLAALEALAAASGATDTYDRDGQPSNAALQEDVAGFRELSWMFPALFLTAAGMATYILLSRLVQSQRPNIGMFLANGMPAGHVLVHYIGYGLAPALVAGIAGAVAGTFLGSAITGLYTESLSIPLTVTEVRAGPPLLGITVGVLAGIVATVVPAWRASRLQPAETMSAAPASTSGGSSFVERLLPPLRLLPLRGKLVLRNITRARGRSLGVMVGVIISLTLIIVAWGMLDSTRYIVSRHFDDINRDDARVFFDHPVGDADLEALGAAGVADAEPMASLRVGLRTAAGIYGTEMLALKPDTELHRFYPPGSSAIGLPENGVLIGQAIRSVLDVKPGDPVDILLPGGEPVETVVSGFVDEPLGTSVYLTLDELARIEEQAALVPGSLVRAVGVKFPPNSDRESMRDELSTLPGVAAYSDSQALKNAVGSLLEFFYVIVGMMLVFGLALAFALIFNSISVTVAERTVEFASLIASGMQFRTVALLLGSETLLVTVLSIVPGLVVAWFVGREFMASFDSDLFRFVWHPETTTLVLSAAGIVLASAASLIPGLRTIGKLDLGATIRERSH